MSRVILSASACLALGLSLAACQRQPTPADELPPPATAPATVAEVPTTAGDAPLPSEAVDYASGMVDTQWQCGTQRVVARFDNAAGSVNLTHERGELVLPQAVSASGARYADGNGNEFWNKGNEATLTLSGQEASSCQQAGAG